MKKLVLGSLLFAALVSQTTGCIISSDPDDDLPDDFATITADWSFHTVNDSGQLSPENLCPPGFPTVALHNQELDLNDRPIGSPIIDLFDCDDGRHASAPLDPAVYETFISVTSDGGGSVYADSLAAIVDVTRDDVTFAAQIVDNGGYFKVAWNLREQGTNAALTCAQAPEVDGIAIDATLTGPNTLIVDEFDCDRGFDFTAALREGSYTVRVEAVAANGGGLGQGVELVNKTMGDRNSVTDLGTITLTIP